jgi:DNA-binding transcriptional regulator YiaG
MHTAMCIYYLFLEDVMSNKLLVDAKKSIAELRSGGKGTIHEPPSPDDIRRYRAERNLTQAQLAQQLEVSLDTVRSWEQGKRNMSKDNVGKLK